MADVAVRDCWSDYERINDSRISEDEKKALDSEIKGLIEDVLEEFLI